MPCICLVKDNVQRFGLPGVQGFYTRFWIANHCRYLVEACYSFIQEGSDTCQLSF